MSSHLLDELDHRIIKAFGKDGRASNRQIATDLGVTEGTIRTRIKRLQTAGLIQFTVVKSFRMAGSPNLTMLGIHSDPGMVPELAKKISEIPEINCVVVLLGRFNLMAMGLFTSLEQAEDLVNARIRALPGIRRVEVSISIHTVKYDISMARITQRDPSAAEEDGPIAVPGGLAGQNVRVARPM